MRCLSILTIVVFVCLFVVTESGPIDKCAFCETVLQCVYGHFSKSVKSKRMLQNALESTCKRYPHYRRSCLQFTKENFVKIFDEMQPGKYNPLQTCIDVQECPQTSATTTTGVST